MSLRVPTNGATAAIMRVGRAMAINLNDTADTVTMIENTFLIAPGIGPKKERSIWSGGTITWDDFLSASDIDGISEKVKRKCDPYIEEAQGFLDDDDAAALGDMLARGEHWRLYRRFRDDASYLDIESDGLERDSLVTVVTVHRKKGTVTLTHGIDLDAETLSDALDGTSVLVTFNGSCFDVPVLRNSFPGVDLDMPHFDLRFGCRKVGYRGGLKHIEKDLGIGRSDDIADVDGEEAVRLWKRWEGHRDRDALETLSEYNRADTINLETISDVIYEKLVTDYAGFGKDT
jgi:uncharacterized protein YprB with RNaseH-like and TPR domain